MKLSRSVTTKYFPALSDRLLFLCGLLMLASEIWKQYTLTFTLGGGSYNWWYFPFQLCSIPMYILLVYPWLRRPEIRRALLAFLMSYTLLGGIAVFADTSGLHYPYAPLTIHSYMWHIFLILLGIFCGMIYFYFFGNKNTLCAFAGSTGLYLICCAAAEVFNLSFDRFGKINMFYINPDYQMQQVVFHGLSLVIGNQPAILLYIAATVFGAFLLLLVWKLVFRLLLR